MVNDAELDDAVLDAASVATHITWYAVFEVNPVMVGVRLVAPAIGVQATPSGLISHWYV